MNKIIYLDAAASALKPESVVAAEVDFIKNKYANSGRGICARAAAVDDMVGNVRMRVACFINARPDQVVFTNGATDGLNRVVGILRETPGVWRDNMRVAVSDLDHHSARMPWIAAQMRGLCDVLVMELDLDYNIDVLKIPVADVIVVTAMSNVLGRAQDVKKIVRAARDKNPDVIIVVDAAQYVAHAPIDASGWGADFICFSGHKIGADTGVGIMYIKHPNVYCPDKFGGGMVNKIQENNWILNSAPEKFEAGTLPLTQIAGMSAAIDSWEKWTGAAGIIHSIYDSIVQNPKIKIFTNRDASVLTFGVDGMHALDFGAMAGAAGVCVRVGNMCATWTMKLIGAPDGGLVRISAGPWNDEPDALRAAEIINKIAK